MFAQRLVRLLIFLAVIGGGLWYIQSAKTKAETPKLSLPIPETLSQQAAQVGQAVLGAASQVLPIPVSLTKETTVRQSNEKTGEVKLQIESQTQQILESIKKLPEQEAKRIRRELLLDFCEKALSD